MFNFFFFYGTLLRTHLARDSKLWKMDLHNQETRPPDTNRKFKKGANFILVTKIVIN